MSEQHRSGPLQRSSIRSQFAVGTDKPTKLPSPPQPPPKAKEPVKAVKPEKLVKPPPTYKAWKLSIPKHPKTRSVNPNDPIAIVEAKVLLARIDHTYPDPDPKGDWPDQQWLEALPIWSQLPESKRAEFSRDAIFYRRIWAARKALVRATFEAMHPAGKPRPKRGVRIGYFQRKTLKFLNFANPEQWILCPIDATGCGGSGVVGDQTCRYCGGSGYIVLRIADLKNLAKELERGIAAYEAGVEVY